MAKFKDKGLLINSLDQQSVHVKISVTNSHGILVLELDGHDYKFNLCLESGSDLSRWYPIGSIGFLKNNRWAVLPGNKKERRPKQTVSFQPPWPAKQDEPGLSTTCRSFFSGKFDFNLAPFPAPKGWQIKITDFMRMFISESTDMDRKSWFLFDLKWIYLYALCINPKHHRRRVTFFEAPLTPQNKSAGAV